MTTWHYWVTKATCRQLVYKLQLEQDIINYLSQSQLDLSPGDYTRFCPSISQLFCLSVLRYYDMMQNLNEWVIRCSIFTCWTIKIRLIFYYTHMLDCESSEVQDKALYLTNLHWLLCSCFQDQALAFIGLRIYIFNRKMHQAWDNINNDKMNLEAKK